MKNVFFCLLILVCLTFVSCEIESNESQEDLFQTQDDLQATRKGDIGSPRSRNGR